MGLQAVEVFCDPVSPVRVDWIFFVSRIQIHIFVQKT